MSGNIVIQASGISKQYRLGMIGSSTVADDLSRYWRRIQGKEQLVRKISDANDSYETIWAVKDVCFEVEQGDVLGIIGKNGAGKSTLLKILSQITQPTSGEIRIKGKIASLLEVGTGFHPELSGRDNIFLNGAILGMKRAEIKSKFDEIVSFSGVEKYIDTPVKRYSSGMYVRLAFAVAAHLEPEILIVDEVLAVGDAEFQQKCLGKMKDVSVQGRTVLFVSHNIEAIKVLCTKAILLEKGMVVSSGDTGGVINVYEQKRTQGNTFLIGKSGDKEVITIQEVKLTNQNNSKDLNFYYGDDIIIDVLLDSKEDIEKPYFQIHLGVEDVGYFTIANSLIDGHSPGELKKGKNTVRCIFKKVPLLRNSYNVRVGIRDKTGARSLTSSQVVAKFNAVTNATDIGFNPILSDLYSKETIPLSIEYSWRFNDGDFFDYKIDNYIKKQIGSV